MQKSQLDKWIHGQHKDSYQPPKVFIIGCADLSQYLLAVEYKHKVEPVKIDDEPMHFDSLELVKEELVRLGVERAYLRLHNAYDECGAGDGPLYYDLEMSLITH
ncbi:lysyl-tRNA synthetase [Vibrio tubiashii]|nr:lysyl-tRNA synthetase [Vibrio tubiashii]